MEIGDQVTESTTIAGKAVHEAGQTNEQVKSLTAAAEKIGDVVKTAHHGDREPDQSARAQRHDRSARAGEAGKGFAVVASEVKALATATAKATDEVGVQIAAMQAARANSASHQVD